MVLTNVEKQNRHRIKRRLEFLQLKEDVKKRMMKIYTVYDSKVEAYMQPFFMQAKGAAIRAFSDIINGDPKHIFAQHPADYTLFELGTWDDANAKFDLLKTPVSLGVGIEFLNKLPEAAV